MGCLTPMGIGVGVGVGVAIDSDPDPDPDIDPDYEGAWVFVVLWRRRTSLAAND